MILTQANQSMYSTATMEPSTDTMIHLQNIEKVYRTDTVETQALNNINLNIGKGEFLSVMGPSGCGKSTLLNIMGLLDAPTKGSVTIDGETTIKLSDKQLAHFRNRKIGFIFQSYHLINDLKVLDNVELPLLYRKSTGKERKELASLALEKVGLSNRMKHFPTQLSGGQKQRVAIARAIVGQPEIILADEPTGNLMEILLQLNAVDRTTIVMVTHDENMAKKTHRLVRLFDGSQVL
jgi:putative ABC transport system ATP-binding protein